MWPCPLGTPPFPLSVPRPHTAGHVQGRSGAGPGAGWGLGLPHLCCPTPSLSVPISTGACMHFCSPLNWSDVQLGQRGTGLPAPGPPLGAALAE